MNNVLEIAGKRYFFKKGNAEGEYSSLALYPTDGTKVLSKSLIKFIKKIVTNYADVVYYIDSENKLRRYSFSTGKKEKLCKVSVSEKDMYVHNRKVYLLSQGETKKQLLELNLSTGKVETIIGSINKIILFENSRMVYFGLPELYNDENNNSKQVTNNIKKSVNVIDVDTKEITVVGKDGIDVEGFIDDYVVYTCKAPSVKNRNLFVKKLGQPDSEKLIEKNIYEFHKIFAGKLLYDIGNAKNKTLIYANADGSERKEWALNIAALLFEQGGWVYFLRTSGYNSILCKAHIGDTSFRVIAKDVKDFVEIKNGYLYYKNFISELIKVRMDGTNYQVLCDDVSEVINIKEDRVVFASVDESTKTSEFSQSVHLTKSIYLVDFTGSGKRKLVYNVNDVEEFDENTVYYTVKEKREISGSYSPEYTPSVDTLYKLDIKSGETEKLLALESIVEEKKKPVFMYAMIAAASLFFIGLLLMFAEAPGAGAFFWVMAAGAVAVGFMYKSKDGEKAIVDQIKEKVTDFMEEKNKNS